MENGPNKRRKLSSSPSDAGSADSFESFEEHSNSNEDKDDVNTGHQPNGKFLNGAAAERNLPGKAVYKSSNRSPLRIANGWARTQDSDAYGSQRLSSSNSDKGVFDFQIDHLLRQVKLKSHNIGERVESTLREVKKVFESMPNRESLPIDQAEKSLLSENKIVIPFPDPRPRSDAKYKLSFQAPNYVNVIGSYALGTSTNLDQDLVIDLFVQMPLAIFTEKDYLNYRYFHKRAYYLACLAENLQSSPKLDLRLDYSLLDGNPLLPTIIMQPRVSNETQESPTLKWRIRVLPGLDSAFFSKQKTLPNKNCVRPESAKEDAIPHSFPPTPFYNGSLRLDCSMTNYLKLLINAANICPGYRDACHLGRVWLRQRGFASGIYGGGFGHFEWAALMAILLRSGERQGQGTLLPNYDCQQLFKATIQFLAMKDLVKQPFGGYHSNGKSGGQSTSGPILLEDSSESNLLFKMTPWSYKSLRQEAQATMKILNGTNVSKFESTFIIKVCEPLECYDLTATVSGIQYTSQSHLLILEEIRDFQRFLVQGLNERAAHVTVLIPSQSSWSINMTRALESSNITLTIGIVVDPMKASRSVERGPPAENTMASAEFREFWGDKAELRRFKDGQILESVVWNGSNSIDITNEIVTFLVNKRLGDRASVTFHGSNPAAVDGIIGQERRVNSDVSKSYLILENQIRSLEHLPLRIRQIQRMNLGSNVTHPVEVVLQFEGSSRWPDDLAAIQMTKVAFLLKLQELMENEKGVVLVRVGLENENLDILNKSFLDVTYSDSTLFRLRIHHDREQTLLEKRLADRLLLPSERTNIAEALSYYKRHFIRKPLHAQAMFKSFTRFPCLEETLRLVRTWFQTHLLANHFRPELIDMITAATFLDPSPWIAPSSAQTGFLRTLTFISKWDWQNDPLVVDFSSTMKSSDYDAARTRFKAWRHVDPLMNRVALFAASDFDPNGDTWTEHMPSKVVSARLISLAQAACEKMKDKGIELKLNSLFQRSLKEYDFVLRLSDSFTAKARSKAAKQPRFKNLQKGIAEQPEDAGFDPVQLYLDELQSIYQDNAVFFYGHGSDVVGGLWSPHTDRKAWKVGLTYSTIPLDDNIDALSEGAEVLLNKGAMLAEMANLGGDLIRGIEVH